MTIRNVPGDFATISLAVAASAPGDTILVDAIYTGNESVSVSVNNLTVSAPVEVTGISLTLATGILKITLAGSADIDVTGNASANSIYGNAGDNHLSGGTGQDHYYGSAGDDVYAGGGGVDFDIVDYSREVLGGATHGVIVNQSAKIVQGGVVQDTVVDGFGDVDSIVGIRNIIGSKFADKIYGGGRDNVLTGLGGADFILGGNGADKLTGGTGADKFAYKLVAESTVSLAGRDDILDFSSIQKDKINLHSMDANSTLAKNQDFSFIDTSAFSHHAGEVRYGAVSDGVVVQGDVNGDGAADFAVHLIGVSTLSLIDFIL